ncbi:coiled-coil-helix-coiled-coil-helix domain containing 6b isoform X2 [Triplophysa dalaica]|uniref:coiled-coil-helix-coiled-coil-helix domain containing 6b isoform X2 n=1 Tax=Triplophysa dalaica TaxID=1582913 RepID=UPI0024DF899C|nr:coiled-coil-helix-coiled-coil-helix domain containing 6b isoform X2 [Triplophysa dalaica]
MGAGESRSVSYGLDEEENVTVLHGVKLSGNVLQRMREPGPSPVRPALSKPESGKSDPGPTRPSAAEMQEELRRRFDREQALVQEELARIAHREREDENPAVLRERARSREEAEKAQGLVRQLKRKEDELKHLAEFYKEQLQRMEKKNVDIYQQTLQIYNQEAVKAETTVSPHNISIICPELQSQVLNCYRENKHQTLQCSQLAREYINCINSSKKNLLVNHG